MVSTLKKLTKAGSKVRVYIANSELVGRVKHAGGLTSKGKRMISVRWKVNGTQLPCKLIGS